MFLYELVTGGRKPVEDLHFRNEIDKAIVDGRALDPITSSGCPPWPDVTDLIAHLLNSQPEKRPTAEEVSHSVKSCVSVPKGGRIGPSQGQFPKRSKTFTHSIFRKRFHNFNIFYLEIDRSDTETRS